MEQSSSDKGLQEDGRESIQSLESLVRIPAPGMTQSRINPLRSSKPRRIPSKGHSGKHHPRQNDPVYRTYEVIVWFEAMRCLSHLVQAFNSQQTQEDPSIDILKKNPFWLSWTLFDKTFHSPEFTVLSSEGQHETVDEIPTETSYGIKRTMKFEAISYDQLVQSLIDVSPLRVFLCTKDCIVGKSEVDISPASSSERHQSMEDPENFMNFQWYPLEPLFKFQQLGNISPAIEIGFDIKEIRQTSTEEDEKKSLQTLDRNQKDDIELESIDEEEYQSRRFRLNVDVRSISNLKRPAYAGIAFNYPYLGHMNAGSSTPFTNPIRTHPLWILANTEVKVDGAKASYDFCLNYAQLRQATAQHDLKVYMTSRSHLGSDVLGEVHVDIAKVIGSDPIMFRCPISGRQFKTLKEYQSYRYSLVIAAATNRIEKLPPKDPAIIRAVDGYYNVHPEGGKGDLLATAQGAKIRVVVILEDFGAIGRDIAVPVKPGYKMQGGGLYPMGNNMESSTQGDRPGPPNPLDVQDLSPHERAHLEAMSLDWENWRKASEIAWMTSLKERETQMRKGIDEEVNRIIETRGIELKQAQEETAKLEIRLRQGIDAIERQKQQLILKESQVNAMLAQKTEELQLLQRRIRDEAKIKIESESRRADSYKNQIATLEEAADRMEKRAIMAEKDFDAYRQQMKSSTEAHLREENIRLKVQLSEAKLEIERERRLRSETEAEKEHFKAQMHRIAVALKREREKNNILARQEIEQLRLDFLTREERYILAGDRDELRNIRHELANLKDNILSYPPNDQEFRANTRSKDSASGSAGFRRARDPRDDDRSYNDEAKVSTPTRVRGLQEASSEQSQRLRQQIAELYDTGLYNDDDPVLIELKAALQKAEETIHLNN